MRRPARRPGLHHVSKEFGGELHTRRSTELQATGSQSRMADFASAFLARDQSTATDFELRQTVATGYGRFGQCSGQRDGSRAVPQDVYQS